MKWIDKDDLGLSVMLVASSISAPTTGLSHLNPIAGAITSPAESSRVNKRLCKVDGMVISAPPITAETFEIEGLGAHLLPGGTTKIKRPFGPY